MNLLNVLQQACRSSHLGDALRMLAMADRLKPHVRLDHVQANLCSRCGWRLGWIPKHSQTCPVCNAAIHPSDVTPKKRFFEELELIGTSSKGRSV